MMDRQTRLPEVLPLFPLAKAILLPRAEMPLNIFEPRYLQMTEDCLRGHRYIGMIQPRDAQEPPALHPIGCAGRITAWSETGDGRFLITLTGVSRFTLGEELASVGPYRQARVLYDSFAQDQDAIEEPLGLDRAILFKALQAYLKPLNMAAEWEPLANAPAESLINTLTMLCPFESLQKQALLSAPSLAERAQLLLALLERETPGASGARLQ